MFFLRTLKHTIQLHPRFFGPMLREHLEKRLMDEKEGTCDGRFGYIVCVLKAMDIGQGMLQQGSGMAEFIITYQAVVFKPFKNQVGAFLGLELIQKVDGIISSVTKMGTFCDVGPLQVFISAHVRAWRFGRLTGQLIPADMKFDVTTGIPQYVYPEDHPESTQWRIAKGEQVRLRIVGLRMEATEFFAIGSIKEEGLGRPPGDAV